MIWSITKSQDKLPIGSPLLPIKMTISRAASSSSAFPRWRRLDATGYFTASLSLIRVIRRTQYSATFPLVEEKRRTLHPEEEGVQEGAGTAS
jgi:hypothetical protein